MEDFSFLDIQRLRKVEALAEEVLKTQNDLLELDRRRHKNREALGVFRRNEISGKRVWTMMNDTFVRLDRDTCHKKLTAEKLRIEDTIEKTRPKLKKSIYDLHRVNPEVSNLHPEIVDLLTRERAGVKLPKTFVQDDAPKQIMTQTKEVATQETGAKINRLDYSRFDHIFSSDDDDDDSYDSADDYNFPVEENEFNKLYGYGA